MSADCPHECVWADKCGELLARANHWENRCMTAERERDDIAKSFSEFAAEMSEYAPKIARLRAAVGAFLEYVEVWDATLDDARAQGGGTVIVVPPEWSRAVALAREAVK